MLHHEVHADARHELEGLDVRARHLLRHGQEARRLVRIGQADDGGRARAGLGIELHDGGGDDAERAFRAHEEVLEVVARIVLLELRQGRHDAPVGEHHFKARHEIARIAIGDDLRAARIGGEIAADGAGAFGGQREREEAVGAVGGFLHLDELQAGFDGHGVGRRVDLTHAVHAAKGQHDLRAALVRRLPAHKAGVAALGHHGRVRLVAELHDRRDFLGGAGTQDAGRPAMPEVALLLEVGGHVQRIGHHMALADDFGEAGQKGGMGGGGRKICQHGGNLMEARGFCEPPS